MSLGRLFGSSQGGGRNKQGGSDALVNILGTLLGGGQGLLRLHHFDVARHAGREPVLGLRELRGVAALAPDRATGHGHQGAVGPAVRIDRAGPESGGGR